MPTYPNSGCYLQGSTILRMDDRIEVRNEYNSIIHRFPLSDTQAIADQGEFYQEVKLSSAGTSSFLFDESLTGFSGNTPATDIDLLYIATSSPIYLEIATGIPFNSVTPGSRNPAGKAFSIHSVQLLRSNSDPSLLITDTFDQRILPFKIWIANSVTSANVAVYMAKFSQ